ncbi:hypothetical protein CsSME_00009697 [Camellia sinensis var. sinensis]
MADDDWLMVGRPGMKDLWEPSLLRGLWKLGLVGLPSTGLMLSPLEMVDSVLWFGAVFNPRLLISMRTHFGLGFLETTLTRMHQSHCRWSGSSLMMASMPKLLLKRSSC